MLSRNNNSTGTSSSSNNNVLKLTKRQKNDMPNKGEQSGEIAIIISILFYFVLFCLILFHFGNFVSSLSNAAGYPRLNKKKMAAEMTLEEIIGPIAQPFSYFLEHNPFPICWGPTPRLALASLSPHSPAQIAARPDGVPWQ